MKNYKIIINIIVLFLLFFNITFSYDVNSKKETDFKVLKLSDEGELVKKCQERLISLDYDCGLCGSDGVYGSNTEKCVKDFQCNNNLTITGDIEFSTYEKLFSEKVEKSKYRVVKSESIYLNNEVNVAVVEEILKYIGEKVLEIILERIIDYTLDELICLVKKAFNKYEEDDEKMTQFDYNYGCGNVRISLFALSGGKDFVCCYDNEKFYHSILLEGNKGHSSIANPGETICVIAENPNQVYQYLYAGNPFYPFEHKDKNDKVGTFIDYEEELRHFDNDDYCKRYEN